MSDNVVHVPFADARKAKVEEERDSKIAEVAQFMQLVNMFCSRNGIDTSTEKYRYSAAVIMTQLQSILLGH